MELAIPEALSPISHRRYVDTIQAYVLSLSTNDVSVGQGWVFMDWVSLSSGPIADPQIVSDYNDDEEDLVEDHDQNEDRDDVGSHYMVVFLADQGLPNHMGANQRQRLGLRHGRLGIGQ
jgi:hypothetical protein